MAQGRLRTRRLGLLALVAAAVVIAAGVAGYALGAPQHASPLRRINPPPRRIGVGGLLGSVSIPELPAK